MHDLHSTEDVVRLLLGFFLGARDNFLPCVHGTHRSEISTGSPLLSAEGALFSVTSGFFPAAISTGNVSSIISLSNHQKATFEGKFDSGEIMINA